MGTGAVSWSSHLQTLHTTSTTQSEYVAAVAAGQEILWLINLFTELGFSVPLGLPMCIDNQSAIRVSKNPEHHGRMKHLDLHFYWLSAFWSDYPKVCPHSRNGCLHYDKGPSKN